MLSPDLAQDAGLMAAGIKALKTQPRPRSAAVPDILGGLSAICSLADAAFAAAGKVPPPALVPHRFEPMRRPLSGSGHG